MAEILKGKAVADSIFDRIRKDAEELNEKNIVPTLAVVRIGEKADDLSYEKNACKRCEQSGIRFVSIVHPEGVDAETYYKKLEELNADKSIHGIMMLRPLPKNIDDAKARSILSPDKDVDGCTDASLAGVFAGTSVGYAPCTAQAVMEILDYYKIELKGKNVTVIGRSLVVGRPVAMLLMHRNATPTICHTRTADVAAITGNADIIICASGAMESVNAAYVREGQTIIDAGISWNDAKGKLCGDVLFEEVEPIVNAITPVPGGVGAVTTAVLLSHVVDAAKKI